MKRRVATALDYIEANRPVLKADMKSRQGGMGIGGIVSLAGRQHLLKKGKVFSSAGREALTLVQNNGLMVVIE